MDDQLAGGERCHVLVWPIGDGGVREGDGLGLGVALHVGGGKCYSCGLGSHRVRKVAVEVANESTNITFTCWEIFDQNQKQTSPTVSLSGRWLQGTSQGHRPMQPRTR